MQAFGYNERKQRGTYDFPFEFHHIDEHHPHYTMPYHWHMEYEIIRILSGTFILTADDEQIQANKGDILFLRGGTLHSGVPLHCVYECIVFDLHCLSRQNESCQKIVQKIIDGSFLPYRHFPAKYTDIHTPVWNLFQSMATKSLGHQLITVGEMLHFIGIIQEQHYYFEPDTLPKSTGNYKHVIQLKKVLEFMETTYDTPVTLSMLASCVDMSPKYFCRFFHQMTHRTPMDYLNYYRIEHACHFLLSSDNSITEVAFSCGFNDLSYFIKTFRKYKGVTPGRYLKN